MKTRKEKFKLNKKRTDLIELGIVILILATFAYTETHNGNKNLPSKQSTTYSKASVSFPK